MDQARIMRLQTGFGTRIEVLKATYQSQTFTRHTHDTYTFGIVLGGAGTFWCRGTEHVATEGDIVAIPPGEVHTGSVALRADLLSYLAVYVPPDVAIRYAESVGLGRDEQPEFASVLFRDGVVREAFEAVNRAVVRADLSRHAGGHEQGHGEDATDEAAAEEAVCVAIGKLIGRRAERHTACDTVHDARKTVREARVVSLVREVIEDSYARRDETSLEALAGRAGVTPFRVIRAFREATGLSPHHYLVQVRVERARRLLADGTLPSMTALMTGFADQSHLTYHFKKHLGITPARYQRCVATV